MKLTDAGFSTEDLRDALSAAPFADRRAARFQDVDAAGIVFFPRLLEYFHDAYLGFLDAHGVRVPVVIATQAWAAPIKHADGEFFRPVRYGDAVEVALVRARIEGSELLIGYRMTGEGGRALAIGRTLSVFVDVKTFRRIDVPADVRAAFTHLAAV